MAKATNVSLAPHLPPCRAQVNTLFLWVFPPFLSSTYSCNKLELEPLSTLCQALL